MSTDLSSNINCTTGVKVKDEPIDEIVASNLDDQNLQRPINISQGNQLQQQQHQAFTTNDQTLILSSRPLRRLASNGPADGKASIQHLFINRKFQMIPQRSVGDDDKDIKPKIIEGAYLKLPTDFNVVSSNASTTINTSSTTSKHSYSFPQQATFHQPITLIGQSQQNQNKVIINPNGQVDYHEISTDLPRNFHDVHRESKNVKITIPTSNLKLNIVPSLAQVMQSGGVLIDAKSGAVTGATRNEMNAASQQQNALEQNVSIASASNSSPNVAQIHYQQSLQQQQQSQQQKVAQHVDRMRILYTNLKNNRGSTQFLAQINPTKVVNIVPIQHKSNASGGSVQGIVNKSLQRVAVSSSQPQNQQLTTAFQRQAANVNSAQANSIIGSNTSSGTLIITTSSASDPSSIINCSINTNVNQNSVLVGNSSIASVTDAALLNLNHNDGNATTINR